MVDIPASQALFFFLKEQVSERMGRREKWYSKIKKALNPISKPRRINAKSKKSGSSESGSKRFGNQNHLIEVNPPEESVTVHHLPQTEHVELTEDINVSNKQQLPQLSKTAAALTPKTTSGIMRHIPVFASQCTEEDTSATQIQTAYRGYMARRTLRALRGLARLKLLVQGHSVKRQATNTLQCMQALTRIQSQVRSRRLHMSIENQALQKQLLLKNSKKHTPFRNSDEWKDCAQSKQRDEEKMKKKHEAAIRRERTLAYSSVHQKTWKSSPKRSSNMTVTDTDNPNWGWSWLERWMAEGLDSMPEITEAEATKEARSLHKLPPSIKIASKPPPNPALKTASTSENNKPLSTRMRLSNASSDSSEKTRTRTHTMPDKLVNTKPRQQSPSGLEHNVTPRKSSSVRPSQQVPSAPMRHSTAPPLK